MSLALTHFALGAGAMVLLTHRWFRGHPYRWTAVIASGLWALVPDLHYVTDYADWLAGLKFTVLGNLFWFHRWLDALNQGDDSRQVAALAVGFLLAAVAVSEVLAAGESRA